jgi:hypothetical protein
VHTELFLDVYRQNAREVEARLCHHRLASERAASASGVASPSRVAAWVTTRFAALRSARPATPSVACCPA